MKLVMAAGLAFSRTAWTLKAGSSRSRKPQGAYDPIYDGRYAAATLYTRMKLMMTLSVTIVD